MKNFKFSRRSFLKAGAAASVAGLVAANAAAASAAEPKAAAAEENGLLDGLFGGALWGAVALWQGGGAALDHPAAALALWGLGVKAFSNVLVIVLNYLFSKLLIFRDPARRGPQ